MAYGGGRYQRDEARYGDYYGNRGGGRDNRTGWGQNAGGFRDGGRAADNRGAQVNQVAVQHLQMQNQALITALQSQTQRNQIPTPYRGPPRSERGGRGRGGGPRPGDKRRTDNYSYGGKRDRRPPPPKKPVSADKKEKVEKEKEEVIIVEDIPDEEVEIPDELMDAVEKLRQRETIERNTADEDIEKLAVFCYTGKGFKCNTTGAFFSKKETFLDYLKQKAHVMKVIDARADKDKYKATRDILDIALDDDWFEKSELAQNILKTQAKSIMKAQREQEAREKLNFNKNPANFFRCEYSARKTAKKQGDQVVFSHLFETTMFVNEFAGDRFFGCEFVKAECGFNCRLCNLYIKDATNVVGHIDSRSHRQQYQNFLKKNPDYEKKQKKQNSELAEALTAEENNYVVLNETKKPGEKVFLDHAEQICVRIPDLLVSKEEEEKKKKEEAEKAAKEEAEKAAKEAEEKKDEAEATENKDKEVVEIEDKAAEAETAKEDSTESEVVVVNDEGDKKEDEEDKKDSEEKKDEAKEETVAAETATDETPKKLESTWAEDY